MAGLCGSMRPPGRPMCSTGQTGRTSRCGLQIPHTPMEPDLKGRTRKRMSSETGCQFLKGKIMSVNWADFKPIADANARRLQRAFRRRLGKFKPISDASPTLADYAKGPLPGSINWYQESAIWPPRSGATNVGKYIRDIGDTGQRYWSDSMTPAGRRAAESRYLRMTRTRSSRAWRASITGPGHGTASLPGRCLLRRAWRNRCGRTARRGWDGSG